jgi:hypothetical protein
MKEGMGRWRRKMEGRVRKTIEEWKEMVGKRRDKMKEEQEEAEGD